MKVSEKTLELTLCSQLSWQFSRWMWPPFVSAVDQPLWFGLTQKQEARAGFDAATRLGRGRILLLQFKAGRRLKRGGIRYVAAHKQLRSLQKLLRNQHRLVFYVLPEVTRSHEIPQQSSWILESTWFLDPASISPLSQPKRSSKSHHYTLNPQTGDVLITSEPIEVSAVRASEIVRTYGRTALGAEYEEFDKFWSYAQLVRRHGVAAALPN